MASYTFTLNGESSELQAHFYPPIELDGEYACGLVDFHSYMAIPNVTDSNNRIYFMRNVDLKLEARRLYNIEQIHRLLSDVRKNIKPASIESFENSVKHRLMDHDDLQIIYSVYNMSRLTHLFFDSKNKGLPYDKIIENVLESLPKSFLSELKLKHETPFYFTETEINVTFEELVYVEIPIGSYELMDIEKKINDLIANILNGFKFSVYPNKNTLKCEVECTDTLFCIEKNNALQKIFGFSNDRILSPNVRHESDSPVQISKTNVIKFECNIVTGAYSNSNPEHTLHEFYPNVEAGYKIIEVPNNVIYLPVTTRTIRDISVRIVDQDHRLIDFRGETISLRLHIKKI